jgi:hypothetical protein
MTDEDRKVAWAEKLVADRCETAVARFLDICEASPGCPFLWESNDHPWSFRVTFLEGKWYLDTLEEEVEGMEEFFKDEDLTSREGINHVICSVLVPLAMDIALGNMPKTTADEFLEDMEQAIPRADDVEVGSA